MRTLAVLAFLLLINLAACTSPEPTSAPDLEATVQALVEESLAETSPATPDLEATIEALVEERLAELTVVPTPTPTPLPSATLTPEQALQERAEAYHDAWLGGNMDEVFRFMSSRYRAVCPQSDFVTWNLGALALVRSFFGVVTVDGFEGETAKVSVNGEEALVHGEFIIRGERMGAEEEGDRWVLVDGQWWREWADWDLCIGEGADVMAAPGPISATAPKPISVSEAVALGYNREVEARSYRKLFPALYIGAAYEELGDGMCAFYYPPEGN